MIRYHARWVLPVHSAPLRDATVVVDEDVIAWVGPRADAPPGDDVNLGDAILIPGLVNAHIHLDLSAFAGVLPRTRFFQWVRSLVQGLSEASDENALSDVARWTVADQLAHGVTTMAHTGPGTHAVDALNEMGARGVAFVEVFGPDPRSRITAIDGLRNIVGRARSAASPLVNVGVSPHAPYSVSDDLYRAVADFAVSEQLPLAVHIAESDDESRLVCDGAGDFAAFLRGRDIAVGPRARSPIDLLEHTGVLRAQPLCIHAVHADREDVRVLAAAGARVVHCPRANAWLRHGSAPVRAFLDAGIAVGLGTDSAASNYGLRMLHEAVAAAGNLTDAERLEMATTGGARALGLQGVVGELRQGYQADIAAFPVADAAGCDADPTRYLLEQCADAPAVITLVSGRVQARHGAAERSGADLVTRVQQHRDRARAWRVGVADADSPFLDSVT